MQNETRPKTTIRPHARLTNSRSLFSSMPALAETLITNPSFRTKHLIRPAGFLASALAAPVVWAFHHLNGSSCASSAELRCKSMEATGPPKQRNIALAMSVTLLPRPCAQRSTSMGKPVRALCCLRRTHGGANKRDHLRCLARTFFLSYFPCPFWCRVSCRLHLPSSHPFSEDSRSLVWHDTVRCCVSSLSAASGFHGFLFALSSNSLPIHSLSACLSCRIPSCSLYVLFSYR